MDGPAAFDFISPIEAKVKFVITINSFFRINKYFNTEDEILCLEREQFMWFYIYCLIYTQFFGFFLLKLFSAPILTFVGQYIELKELRKENPEIELNRSTC